MLVDGLKLLENSSITNLVVDSGITFPTSPEVAEIFFYTNTSDSVNPVGLYYSDGTHWNQIVSEAVLTAAFGTVSIASNFTMGSNATAGSNALDNGGTGPFPMSPAPVEGQFFYYSNASDSANQKGLYVYDTVNKWTFCGTPSSALPTVGELAWLSSVSSIPSTTVAYISNLTSDAQSQINSITSSLSGYATLVSPTFTGTPAAPTVTSSDNSTKIATTAFVQSAIAGVAGGMIFQGTWDASTNVSPTLADGVGTKGQFYIVSVAGTTSFVTATGTVNQWNVGDLIVYDGTHWNKVDGIPSEVTSVAGRVGAVTLSTSDISGISSYALLASPSLTGTPTAPTATAGTNTTQIATTAFVTSAISGFSVSPAYTSITSIPTILASLGSLSAGTAGHLQIDALGNVSVDTTSYAPISSPTLTGIPLAPTATSGTNTTQIATTAYVTTAITNLQNGLSYTLEAVTTAGATTDKAITITNATSSVDTTHGALIVTGGVGVGGALHAGQLYSAGELFVASVINAGYNSGNTPGTMAPNNPAAFYIAPSTFNDNVSASNTYAHATIASLSAATLSSTNNITYNNASTLYIDGAPYAAGGNITLNNTYSLYVNSGASHFSGTTTGITPTLGDNSTKFATTAFVHSTVSNYVGSIAWSTITGTPTTLAGYGITDGVTSSSLTSTLSSYATTSSVTSAISAQHTTDVGLFAPIASPSFTGTPLAPTATSGTNTTQIATTAFVQSALGSVAGGMTFQGTWNASTNTSPALVNGTGTKGQYYVVSVAGTTPITTISGVVNSWSVGDIIVYDGSNWDKINGASTEVTSVAGRIGAVTLSTSDISGISSYALLASPTFTGTPTAPTALNGTNTTQIATTAFVHSSISAINYTSITGIPTSWAWTSITGTPTTLSGYGITDAVAYLASPNFTGTPTAPTALNGTNTTQIATTAFVYSAISGFSSTPAWSSITGKPTTLAGYGITDGVTSSSLTSTLASYLTTSTAASTYAPIASPTFTGVPSGPTALAGTNTTQLATTAFVTSALGGYSATPAWTSITSVPTILASVGLLVIGSAGHLQVSATGVVSIDTTSYLSTSTASSTYAPIASPTFTGTPAAPTATVGTNTTQIATTAFVQSALASVAGGMTFQGTWNASTNSPTLVDGTGTKGQYYVVSVAGTTPITTISGLVNSWQVGDIIVYDGTDWDKINGAPTEVTSVAGRIGAVTLSTSDISGISSYALLASPSLTGTPLAPTATTGTNTTQIATTAFVTSAIGAINYTSITGIPTSWAWTSITSVPTILSSIGGLATGTAGHLQVSALGVVTIDTVAYAPLASPALTGTPTAPTATVGTNTTQVATTAFVTSAVSAATPTWSSLTGTATSVPLSAGEIATATVTTSSTSATPLVSLPIATYRGFKATVSVTYATTPAYQLTEILVLHDGTNTNLVEYGDVMLPTTDTPSTLTTFSTTISGGNVQLVATSANAGATKYQVIFTALNI